MYFVIFATLILCAFFSKEKPNPITFLSVVVVIVLFVGFRSPYIDMDYQNYVNVGRQGIGISEQTYYWLYDLSYILTNDTTLMFVIYALIGVVCQLNAIYKHSNMFWLSMVLFFPTYFVMLDMNAIRAGAGIGITMLAWQPWAERQTKKTLLLLLLATSFHYSIGIMFVMYPLLRNNSKFLNIFLASIPFIYIFHSFVNLETLFGALSTISFIALKSTAYSEGFEPWSIFSTVFLVRIVVIAFLYYYRETLSKHFPLFYLLFKFYIVGLFVAILFADIPPISSRLSDIFLISELVLLPYMIYTVKQEKLVILGLSLYASFYFYLNVMLAQVVKPYETIL